MSSSTNKIQRQNGEIVMQALHSINEPATIAGIVRHIANKQKLETDVIKEPIKQVLDRAVDLGFVKREAGKYFLDTRTEEDEDANDNEDDEENVDKSGYGRRRSRSRSSRVTRRKGTRSRSRRQRSGRRR